MANKLDVQLGSLDFDDIKQSIINHLKTQDTLKDYDYTGSAAQVLLDILAYNTLYYGYYANMIASEMFLDTAQKEESLISLVKPLGYVIPGKTSSRARVKVRGYGSGNPIIPAYTKFIGNNSSGIGYGFYTIDDYSTDDDGESVVTIVEAASLNKEIPLMVDQKSQKGFLSGLDIDIGTIQVEVYDSSYIDPENPGTGVVGWQVWGRAGNIEDDLDSKSRVYWLERTELGFFVVFGGNLSNVIGQDISPNDKVRVTYLKSSGESGNRIGNFKIADGSGAAVDTISLSTGGTDKPDLEAIRFFAPKWFASQDRAVTVEDCRALLAKEGFVSGDQDPYSRFNVWGGEQMEPPRYGRVFVTLDVPSNEDPVQATVARQILAEKTCVSIIPEYIDMEDFILKIDGDVFFDPRRITRDDYRNKVFTKIDNLYGDPRFERSYSLSQIVNEINSVSDGSYADVVNLRLQVTTNLTVSQGYVKNKYYANKMKSGSLKTVEPVPVHESIASQIDAPDGLISIKTIGDIDSRGRQKLQAYYEQNGFDNIVDVNIGYWEPNSNQCAVVIKPKIFADGQISIVAQPKSDEGTQKYVGKTNQYTKLGTDLTFRITG